MSHATVAVGLDRFGPFGEQTHGFVQHRGVAGGAINPRHAAQPLSENGVAVARAPAAERLAGSGQAGGGAVAVQDVVLRQLEPKLAGRLELLLPPARQQSHAAIVERLQFSSAGRWRNHRGSALGGLNQCVRRDRRRFQEFTTWHLSWNHKRRRPLNCFSMDSARMQKRKFDIFRGASQLSGRSDEALVMGKAAGAKRQKLSIIYVEIVRIWLPELQSDLLRATFGKPERHKFAWFVNSISCLLSERPPF